MSENKAARSAIALLKLAGGLTAAISLSASATGQAPAKPGPAAPGRVAGPQEGRGNKPIVRPNCALPKKGIVRPNCALPKKGIVRPNCGLPKKTIVRPNCGLPRKGKGTP